MAEKNLVVANWKCNGGAELVDSYLKAFLALEGTDVVVCPPVIFLTQLQALLRKNVSLGAQDLSNFEVGPYTGEISSEMILECGGTWTLIGHSERRALRQEGQAEILQKLQAANRVGLKTILCVGETLDHRKSGLAVEAVLSQLDVLIEANDSTLFDNLTIAYEPIWAIGTGKVPSLDDIKKTHGSIRALLSKIKGKDASQRMRVLYGGSVKPGNAKDIFSLEDVDGALVGGASLKAADLLEIAKYAHV